jgi:hypothetical protein
MVQPVHSSSTSKKDSTSTDGTTTGSEKQFFNVLQRYQEERPRELKWTNVGIKCLEVVVQHLVVVLQVEIAAYHQDKEVSLIWDQVRNGRQRMM